jgi:hypothetical protein
VAQIQGNGISKEILESAGILKAKAVLALTDNDLTNLMVGFQAAKLKPRAKIVLRSFDPDLAERLQSHHTFTSTVSSTAIAAATFVAAALDPQAIYGMFWKETFFLIKRQREVDAYEGTQGFLIKNGEMRVVAHPSACFDGFIAVPIPVKPI